MSACSAIATFLAGEEVAAHLHRERHVEHQHGRRARELLGALDLEVVGRAAAPACPSPGAQIAFLTVCPHVEVERVAELVRLVLVGALVAEAGALDLVAAGAVLQQLAEEVAERLLADARGCPWA